MFEDLIRYILIYIIPSLLTCLATVGVFYFQLKNDRKEFIQYNSIQRKNEDENKFYQHLLDTRPYIIINKNINLEETANLQIEKLERFLLLKNDLNDFDMDLATSQCNIIIGLENVGNGPALQLTLNKNNTKYIFGGYSDRKVIKDIYYTSSIDIPPNRKKYINIEIKYQPEIKSLKSGLIGVDIEYYDLLNNKIILPVTFLISSRCINGYGNSYYELEEINRLLYIKSN